MIERVAASLRDRYEIEREIGAGGMATVYLARDLRHERQVAIKVLRFELSAVLGGERFLNEIKLAAHLQHPHILPLYDSGSADGMLYYVMPFVAGESLRQRLDREQELPVADAVRIACDVADALDYAHRQGVIHRDIKPDNILLNEGRPLVADFGIALALREAGGTRLTETGISIGTPQYMSPEQATADREVDGRSDVFSLGCVLYEMLAGEPPHTGPTSQAILAKIITDRPRPITELRDTVPAHVATALGSALAKRPADRHGTAAKFAEALVSREKDPGWPTGSAAGRAVPMRWTSARSIAAFVAMTVFVFVAGWILRSWTRSADSPAVAPSRLSIPIVGLPQGGSDLRHRWMGLTPDGSAVIYAIESGGRPRVLMSQRLGDLKAAPIPGSEKLFAPDVSPDGHWIFGREWRGNGLRISKDDGTARQLQLAGGVAFGAWHPDGSLWLSREPYQTLERVPPTGVDSPQVQLSGLRGIKLQQILDDGRTALAIEVVPGATDGAGVIIDLRTGRVTPILQGPVVQVRYTMGHLVHARPNGDLLATPFDAAGKRLTDATIPIATGIVVAGIGEAQFSVARNGTVAYVPSEPATLVLMDRAGNARLATEERQNFHAPRFSPDGRRISVDLSTTDGRDIWVLDRDQSTLSRATFVRDAHDASWTPDGRFLTYLTFRSGQDALFKIMPGGRASPESLSTAPDLSLAPWLPDARGVVAGASGDIVIIGNGGRGPREPVAASRFSERAPALSPDGRWVAFTSDQNGQTEVFARRVDGQAELFQVSQSAGSEPVWGPRGRELFYRAAVGTSEELIVASVEFTPRFRVASRRTLFSVSEYSGAAPHANYDVSPDGRTLAMVRRSPSTRIVVIQNLPALVRAARPELP